MRSSSPTVWTIVAALAVIHTAAAGTVERPVVRSYALDVTFFPDESRLEGTAEIDLESAKELPSPVVFYLHGELAVEKVTIGGRPVEVDQRKVLYDWDYSSVATRVEVPVDDLDPGTGITVAYAGFFHPSKVGSISNYMRIDEDGVLLRSYGYSLWFPVLLEAKENSYPVSFRRVTLRTPADYIPVFTGTWLSESVEGHLRTSEWRAEDVDLFHAQCTALRFAVTREENTFVYSFRDRKSRQSASRIAELARRLDEMFRERYRRDASTGQLHVMQMPRYGDISSGNVIGLTSDSWLGIEEDDWAQRILGHELVHAYVHVPTDRSDRLWSLAIEGFPSYFHLPVLAKIVGEEFYERFLDRTEEGYLDRRRSGEDRRGRPLPPEKPPLAIHADEMSTYKDRFVLNDRVLLFFDWIRRQLGAERFYDLTRELFQRDRLSEESFEATILRFLPDAKDDIRVWLETTEFPERFHRPR
jgi:hypothetical protein